MAPAGDRISTASLSLMPCAAASAGWMRAEESRDSDFAALCSDREATGSESQRLPLKVENADQKFGGGQNGPLTDARG
jgi:hypothetical protein